MNLHDIRAKATSFSPELHLRDPGVPEEPRHAVHGAADYAALAAVTRGVQQQDTHITLRHLIIENTKMKGNDLEKFTSPTVH